MTRWPMHPAKPAGCRRTIDLSVECLQLVDVDEMGQVSWTAVTAITE